MSVKPERAIGVALLLIAAFFSLALLLQLLDYGSFRPDGGNALFSLGRILTAVYGFSSALIPLFLFTSAVLCFADGWTPQKSIQFLTASAPFFSVVIIEKLCRSIYMSAADFPEIKILLTVSIGLMLVFIEILASSVLADKILFYLEAFKAADEAKSVPLSEPKPAIEETAEDDTPEAVEKNPDVPSEDAPADNHDEPAPQKMSDENPDSDAQDQAAASMPPEAEQEDDALCENNTVTAEAEKYDPFAGVFDEIDTTPSSVITPEEYVALTHPEPDFPEDSEVEELEWPDTSEIKAQAGNIDFLEEEFAAEYDGASEFDEISATEAFAAEMTVPFPQKPGADNPYADAEYIDAIKQERTDSYMPENEEVYTQIITGVCAQEPAAQADNFASVCEASVFGQDNENNEYPVEEAAYESVASSDPSDAPTKPDSEPDPNAFESVEDAPSETQEETLEPERENSSSGSVTDTAPDIPAALDPDFFDIDMNDDLQDDFDSQTYSVEEENDTGYAARHFKIAGATELCVPSEVFKEMDADAYQAALNTPYTEEEFRTMIAIPISPELPAVQKISVPECAQLPEAPAAPEIAAKPIVEAAVSPSAFAAAPVASSAVRPKPPYYVPTSLLTAFEDDKYWIIDEETEEDSIRLKDTLNEFNIEAEIIGIKKGPVVTMFELLPAHGVRLSKIVALQDNIALRLAASSVRIVAPIPGRAAVGIEVPNKKRSIVGFREIIEQDLTEFKSMAIPVVLGKDILGKPQLLDLVKTPHLLIAGATGAGKSVCVNSMILSILYKRSPDAVKLILIDPKIVELKLYNDIPHLLTPVITEPKRAFQSLQYCLCEMERRYALLDGMGVRDISSYNRRITERRICTEKLPYIVVVIDEFADLMATTGKELESTVARLAAMSRAVGIHLVLATQRPSIDVITGLIKANIPSRIAFMVASKTDSRIIIDQMGAEMLLGKGDMLYASAVDPFPVRIQGTFVSDNDVESVVDYVKSYGAPDYIDDEIFVDDADSDGDSGLMQDGADPLYEQALDVVIQSGKASASYIQRRLKIGYNRAARLIEEMEERGIVGPANGSKPREIVHIPG